MDFKMDDQSRAVWRKFMETPVVVKDPTASYRFVIIDLTDGRQDATRRVKSLLKKRVLTEQESDSLQAMIDSEDLENLELAKGILDEKEKVKVGIEAFVDKLKFWKK